MRTDKVRVRPRLRVERLEDRAVPAVFYVANGGFDGSSGSAASPWATLQYAANQVRAGDTVVVRAGEYAGFDLFTDGTAAARITFRSETPGGAVVTQRNPRTPDGLNLEGADYVTVDGFTVVGMPRAGIRSVANRHVEIRNNTTDSNNTWGIFTGFSDDLLIEYNVTSNSAEQHGIYVSNSGDRPVVRGNVVYGNAGSGIQLNADGLAGGDGVITGALIENNFIAENGWRGGASINLDGVQNSVIRNNLITGAHATGIALFRQDGAAGSANNLVVNNTVLVAADGRWALSINGGSTGNTVRNNVLYSEHPFRGGLTVSGDSRAGLVSDYNLVEDRFSIDNGGSAVSLAVWQAWTGLDGNSFTTDDPYGLFVDPVNYDFHLAAGSPAIDRGTPTGAPAFDFEGTARPSGSGPDIGHDELGGVSPPSAPPVVAPIGDRTIPSGQDTVTVTVSATDPDGTTPVLSASAQSLALVLDQQLGLRAAAGGLYENAYGGGEKWLLGRNGPNDWYFVLPNGQLWRWGGQVALTGTLVGTPGATYHARPELLYNAEQAFDLDRQLGLRVEGSLYENYFGAGERWVLGQNSQWYFVRPDGRFYLWDGSGSASGTQLASLGSSYHELIRLLYEGDRGQALATLGFSGNQLTVDRDDGTVAGVVVTVTASDGALTGSQTFTVTVTA